MTRKCRFCDSATSASGEALAEHHYTYEINSGGGRTSSAVAFQHPTCLTDFAERNREAQARHEAARLAEIADLKRKLGLSA